MTLWLQGVNAGFVDIERCKEMAKLPESLLKQFPPRRAEDYSRKQFPPRRAEDYSSHSGLCCAPSTSKQFDGLDCLTKFCV